KKALGLIMADTNNISIFNNINNILDTLEVYILRN
ncbi:serine protease, partial [Clostridium botulinum]|nr:serine protease [Clostridium botulinum]